MKNLRPNSQRANNAITLIWIVTVVELILLALNLYMYNLYHKAMSGLTVTTTEIESIESKAFLSGILFIIVFISSAVAFIQWFRRAYFNLHQRASNLEFSEGWAAGAWFVPIVNLGRPYKIMKELYATTINFLHHHNKEPKIVKYLEIIGWWWAIWLISAFSEQISSNITRNAESLESFQWAITFSIISNLLALPLALLATRAIKNYNILENQMAEVEPNENIETPNPNNQNPDNKPLIIS